MSGVPGQPNDNPGSILPGDAINFPNPFVNPYSSIQRVTNSDFAFQLPPDGIFEITIQITISNTGAIVLTLNGNELGNTVIGKSGGGFITGSFIIATPPSPDPSILSVTNPASAPNGGINVDESTGALTEPITCHLIIKQIS